MPGVSEKTIWKSSPLKMPLILCRVVCALFVITASLSPIKAFINVDFPTFGFPRILTNPALCFIFFTKIWFTKKQIISLQPEKVTNVGVVLKKIVRGGGAEVARWAHNPKAGGSNPSPRYNLKISPLLNWPSNSGFFCYCWNLSLKDETGGFKLWNLTAIMSIKIKPQDFLSVNITYCFFVKSIENEFL